MQHLHVPPPQNGSMQQQMSPETPLIPSCKHWVPGGGSDCLGTLTSEVGGRRQALAELLLDGGCDRAVPQEKCLHGDRADRGGYMCSMLLPLPQMPPWVRSELAHVWVGTTPKACTMHMYHLQDGFLGKLCLSELKAGGQLSLSHTVILSCLEYILSKPFCSSC